MSVSNRPLGHCANHRGDPEGVEQLFGNPNIAYGMCEVVVGGDARSRDQLAKLFAALFMAEVNVHFTYPLLDPAAWQWPRSRSMTTRVRLVGCYSGRRL